MGVPRVNERETNERGHRMERHERVATLAKESGIPARSLYAAIERGEMKALRPNGCKRGWRIARGEFARWVASKTY